MRLVRGRAVIVPSIMLMLLAAACDTAGLQPVPSASVAGSPLPALTPNPGILPDALMTEALAGAGVATPASISAALSEEDRETIYGLVVLNMVRPKQAATVYLNPYLGQGERLDETDPARPL